MITNTHRKIEPVARRLSVLRAALAPVLALAEDMSTFIGYRPYGSILEALEGDYGSAADYAAFEIICQTQKKIFRSERE